MNHRQVNAQLQDIEARRRAREELHRTPDNKTTPTYASASGSYTSKTPCQGGNEPDIVMSHAGNSVSDMMKHLIRMARPEKRQEVIQEVLQDKGVCLDLDFWQD